MDEPVITYSVKDTVERIEGKVDGLVVDVAVLKADKERRAKTRERFRTGAIAAATVIGAAATAVGVAAGVVHP